MIGGLFDGHPWGANGTWALKLDEPAHTIVKAFNAQNFKIKDEIYQFKGSYSREKCRVLISVDLSDEVTRNRPNQKREDKDNAVCWIRPYGAGRVFYCSLGHNAEVFTHSGVLGTYLAGIQYALGDLKCDDTPSKK
jgi:type 1 glutamine amidotransferase